MQVRSLVLGLPILLLVIGCSGAAVADDQTSLAGLEQRVQRLENDVTNLKQGADSKKFESELASTKEAVLAYKAETAQNAYNTSLSRLESNTERIETFYTIGFSFLTIAGILFGLIGWNAVSTMVTSKVEQKVARMHDEVADRMVTPLVEQFLARKEAQFAEKDQAFAKLLSDMSKTIERHGGTTK